MFQNIFKQAKDRGWMTQSDYQGTKDCCKKTNHNHRTTFHFFNAAAKVDAFFTLNDILFDPYIGTDFCLKFFELRGCLLPMWECNRNGYLEHQEIMLKMSESERIAFLEKHLDRFAGASKMMPKSVFDVAIEDEIAFRQNIVTSKEMVKNLMPQVAVKAGDGVESIPGSESGYWCVEHKIWDIDMDMAIHKAEDSKKPACEPIEELGAYAFPMAGSHQRAWDKINEIIDVVNDQQKQLDNLKINQGGH